MTLAELKLVLDEVFAMASRRHVPDREELGVASEYVEQKLSATCTDYQPTTEEK